MCFDPDALLAALPCREIKPLNIPVRCGSPKSAISASALTQRSEYNGFAKPERDRTARLSVRLERLGLAPRPLKCELCGEAADDEHAENYYDLSSWVGLCLFCHRTALHNRFRRPERWLQLLDKHELPSDHWSRLVSAEPFDLAKLLRDRGRREPSILDFAQSPM